jgi:foldase protein PrsA
MGRWIQGVRPRIWSWRKVWVGAGLLGGLGIAFCCGRYWSLPTAQAAPPAATKTAATPTPPTTPSSDSARRPVAYIYGSHMISREELGEYLIAREGAAKLQFLVNRKIIEDACKKRGFDVTQGEVEASLASDLKDLQLTPKQFENRLLKQYRKSMFEWKEDVIWPKLALTKIARDRIKVEQKDLQDAFDAYHGEKVDGRLIIFKPEEKSYVLNKIYAEIRSSEDEFNRYAKMQASPTLAARGGRLDRSIGHNTTGDPELEKEIFTLKPGEVSSIMERPEGIVVFKCDRHIPADNNVKLEDVRAKLEKEIVDKKIQAELPKVFEQLRAEANPQLFIKQDILQEDLEREVKAETDQLYAPGKAAADAKAASAQRR